MTIPTIVADGLDADAIAEILAARQHALAGVRQADERPIETLLTFDLGGVAHGLPIDCVRAVAPLPKVTRLPGAPATLDGLVAWRGTVVNLFALATLLDRDADGAGTMIVLRHDAPRIALSVDAVSGVVTMARQEAATALSTLVIDGDERLTRIDPVVLIDRLLPARLQEG
ncbi:chemotaxis protein CheW [uncultured Sphingomonas sp.]|uniref:chemotaxis protein CheW n=1 Tax=uncultured Sphingomonas sp. TaxID=158754 RepID=UPI0025D94F9C|nr:chemotaxis protein CheW [uncultured Sphingomonas sp.]